mmetsp:Transcript_51448/g.85261  ORF Transcript_51448/g.85261 Transcript_51448/m.85261 type:complete len:149 (-) Transcript_51448:1039-1485(-)
MTDTYCQTASLCHPQYHGQKKMELFDVHSRKRHGLSLEMKAPCWARFLKAHMAAVAAVAADAAQNPNNDTDSDRDKRAESLEEKMTYMVPWETRVNVCQLVAENERASVERWLSMQHPMPDCGCFRCGCDNADEYVACCSSMAQSTAA